MGWFVGKEEESVQKEMKVFGLLPRRTIYFEAWLYENASIINTLC